MPETHGAPRRRDERSQPSRERDASGRDAPLYGALDLGTNNCRLLIARPSRDGFRVVDSFSRIVRLGEGLSRTGRLDPRAMDRAYDALALCADRIVRKGVESVRLSAVATQACRAAENGAEFIDRVRKGTGLRLRIIDPAEEARLAVEGCLNLIDPKAEAVLIIDVGGGSTELSWLKREDADWKTTAWMSAPLGVVTLADPDMYYEGGLIFIDHGQGLTSAFLHLGAVNVEVGQEVAQGQVIGEVGSGGRSTGAHLDWRIKWHNRYIDPAAALEVDPSGLR